MATSQDGFWGRVGLEETDRAICIEAVRRKYDRRLVEDFEYQGYCSFTLLVSRPQEHITTQTGARGITPTPESDMTEQVIVQIRPARHALDLDVTWEASRIYPSLAPRARALGVNLPGNLCAYEMSLLAGTPLPRLRPLELLPVTETQAKQVTLVTSFARVLAHSWPSVTSRKRRDSVWRSDSPSSEEQTVLPLCTGKVGSCIMQKLQQLAQELPDNWLRERAKITLDKLRAIDDYPVVLNHGDLIPSNILVNEETWQITGLVDWAEAEYLPFGTCLYGLEHLLGFLQAPSQELSSPTFVYYDNAAHLRELFWATINGLVPELGGRQGEVRVMRDLGVLLWHGYAWDEGTIDRVVDEVNDDEELAKLRAFLSA